MKLILKFTDDSPSFASGVEFGRILEKMQRGDEVVENDKFPVRIENKSIIEDACKHYGYSACFGTVYQEEWIDFIGVKKTFSNN